MREGKDLIEHCARELEAVGDALEELRLEELVARLERDGAGTRDTSAGHPGNPEARNPEASSADAGGGRAG